VQNVAASAMSKSAKFLSEKLSDVDIASLGVRSKKIYELVTETAFVSQNLAMLIKFVVLPLQIMSKGATGSRSDENFYTKSAKLGMLSQGAQIIGGAIEQRRLQNQAKLLSTKDMTSFFLAMQGLNEGTEVLLEGILAATKDGWGEDILAVGEVFSNNLIDNGMEKNLQL
jgi:hypothetical protein